MGQNDYSTFCLFFAPRYLASSSPILLLIVINLVKKNMTFNALWNVSVWSWTFLRATLYVCMNVSYCVRSRTPALALASKKYGGQRRPAEYGSAH
jgi:hypothetical protein